MKKKYNCLFVILIGFSIETYAGTGGARGIGIIFMGLLGILLLLLISNYTKRIISFLKKTVILILRKLKDVFQKASEKPEQLEISIQEI
jgi:hypothetical protein